MSRFDHLRHALTLAGPADPRQIAYLRRDHGAQVPEDYLSFLTEHDGAGGEAGQLSPAAEVGWGEDVAPEHDHLRGLVVFGTNGAGEVFVFDADAQATVIPWIGDREDGIPQGTFTEFLARFAEGRLFA